MSFQHGLSGLNSASTSLDSIGNNVANASTVGFKAGQAQFADVYANSLNGSSGSKIGIGSKVSQVVQEFTQGNTTTTQNPLDVAINGNGFFRLSNDGAITYARNGQFHLTKDGYIANADESSRLTGYLANAQGMLATGQPVELKVNTSDLPARATTNVNLDLGLDPKKSEIDSATYPFDPDDPTTYSNATAATVYDSLGIPHVMQTFYVKTAVPTGGVVPATAKGAWDVYTVADTDTPPYTALGTLLFDGAGNLDGVLDAAGTALSATDTLTRGLPASPNAITTQTFTIDFTGSTQRASKFGVNSLTQDGCSSGRLSNFSISEDGLMVGNYTNGETAVLGQVVLANFSNPNGLQPIGNNQWVETATSGQPLVGGPDSSGMGKLQSYAVEDSNVDLTQELVNMITAQRVYQANAQTIKTEDSIMQTLVNLR